MKDLEKSISAKMSHKTAFGAENFFCRCNFTSLTACEVRADFDSFEVIRVLDDPSKRALFAKSDPGGLLVICVNRRLRK